MGEFPNFRSRKFALLLYQEDASHMAAMELLKAGGYRYAAILHDKDTYGEHDSIPEGIKKGDTKKPHYHVVLKFPNDRWRTAMSNELGIDPNYIQKCTSYDGALLYLIHAGEPDKYQYPLEAVEGPLKDDLEKLCDTTDEEERVMEIVDMVRNSPGVVTYTEVLIKACKQKRYGDLRRMGSGVKWLIDDHNRAIEEEFYGSLYKNAYADLQQRCGDLVANMTFREHVDRLERQRIYKVKEGDPL